jgi:K+-transporting ATPase ATPase A chain
MNTEGKSFAGVPVGTIGIVGALMFLPVLAIGAIVEYFALLQGTTFFS